MQTSFPFSYMNAEKFYTELKERFVRTIRETGIEDPEIAVSCRSLTPEEAIGHTRRKDFPILRGKDVMIEARCGSFRGQAFTDAPSSFQGSLAEILAMDIIRDAPARSLFIAALNAVMASLGKCVGTVHCHGEGPEKCSRNMKQVLLEQAPQAESVALIGYQPALLQMLVESGRKVRVLDLNPANIGQVRWGVRVEDGSLAFPDVVEDDKQLILCTGSTVCNGTIVNYLDIRPRVLFYGITLAGTAPLMHLHRVCFADEV
jgi:uncharacterized protein (DUF4213/DUF364 family)